MKHVDPREAERPAERERIRARIEARIEKLIAKLDRMDPDPDLEPSLCGPATWHDGDPAMLDAEADYLGQGDFADDEPTLGARPLLNQARGWGDGGDRWSDECEADTPDGKLADSEPWLGSIDGVRSQDAWAWSSRDDREGVNEDGDPLDSGEDDEAEREGDGDADRESENYVGGYTEDVRVEFCRRDVKEAAARARAQTRGLRRHHCERVGRYVGGAQVVSAVTP